MIEYLQGKILDREGSHLILDVKGVGYGVECPLNQISKLEGDCSLWIYTRVKEDELKLYGFSDRETKQIFEILLGINGIGPKIALAIVSDLSFSVLEHAVLQNQPHILSSVPGIGARTAEKILVELKSKLDKLKKVKGQHLAPFGANEGVSSQLSNHYSDLMSALANLGFSEKLAKSAYRHAEKSFSGTEFSELVLHCLQFLGGKHVDIPESTQAQSPDSSHLQTLF